MNDALVSGWAAVYPHLSYRDPAAAIGFLTDAFGLRERVRMAGDDGSVIVAKLETPGGGLVMVGTPSPEWMRERAPEFRQPDPPAWPHLTHSVSVAVDDVDAHHRHACARDAVILMAPTDHPWGLRTYAALDPEGHQWEFCQVLAAVAPEAWGATVVS
jgi:uncharacterized glyoxalase superfamily protein PhnB